MEKIKELPKKIIALFMSFIMLLSFVVPIRTVFAVSVAKNNININVTFNNARGEVLINGTRVTGDAGEVTSYSGTAEDVGYTSSSETNEITINTAFLENVATAVTINGVSYNPNGTDSNTFTVNGSETYTIVVDGASSVDDRKTIIWANPGATDIDSEDALIKNGYARIIAVYVNDNHKLNPSEYINTEVQPDGSKSDDYGLNKGNGWALVKAGYKVVFEFTPEYGYQLTKVEANEQTLEAQDTINQYSFIMPNANVHFSATFSKTNNVLKPNSELISGGSIELGNDLNGGTAQLNVSDVEIDSNKIAGFTNAAGDYTISNYLAIDLFNIFYKGKNDSNDVWSNQIDKLDEYATISIKLEEGINADDIVLVHNIHDGEEYEIIKIDSYDSETNTITFKTKSFSNYAIATKAGSQASINGSLNPSTGDNIVFYIGMLGLSIIGLAAAGLYVRKRNFN